MSDKHTNSAPINAWIIFTDRSEIGWLKILKRGYRHCYALLHDGAHWILYEPLAGYTDIKIHHDPNQKSNLPLWFSSNGNHVIPVGQISTPPKMAPIAFYTCVEAVKRLIGLHKQFILTPYQLYRYLHKQKKETYHG